MTFDPSGYNLSGYLHTFDFGREDWVSIKDKRYPPESVSPSGEARFHHIGEPAYYAASGIQTAKAEVFRDPDADIPDTHDIYSFPEGAYQLFDAERFLRDWPDASGVLDPDSHEDGRRLRAALEDYGCSGVVYPSVRVDGGRNASVWPLDGSPLPSGEFFQDYTGPR